MTPHYNYLAEQNPARLRANQLRTITVCVGGERADSDPCQWQISLCGGEWMNEKTLSYCSVKSINPSKRSRGLLAGINHTERQIKNTRQTMTVKISYLIPLSLSDWGSEIAHICSCYPPKNTFRWMSFTEGVAVSHTVNHGVIFPFSVQELWLLFPGGCASWLWPIFVVCFCDMWPFLLGFVYPLSDKLIIELLTKCIFMEVLFTCFYSTKTVKIFHILPPKTLLFLYFFSLRK